MIPLVKKKKRSNRPRASLTHARKLTLFATFSRGDADARTEMVERRVRAASEGAGARARESDMVFFKEVKKASEARRSLEGGERSLFVRKKSEKTLIFSPLSFSLPLGRSEVSAVSLFPFE